MKIAVVGTGYVGLVSGTCFADSGNTVTCLDIDAAKIARLERGDVPIYEPGLDELVARNHRAGRLRFTTDTAAAIAPAEIVFLAVGTPPAADGSADLSALWKVVATIAPHLRPDAIVVTKSTVPVGTCAGIERRLREATGRECRVARISSSPGRVITASTSSSPSRSLTAISPLVRRRLYSSRAVFLTTPSRVARSRYWPGSPESAEMTKYVANALLSTKISFINEVANLCERIDADIDDVRRGIGHDKRIGFAFLFPGA